MSCYTLDETLIEEFKKPPEIPTGNTTNLSPKNIQVKIQVDTTELESAIEKMERFITLLQKA